MNCLFLCGIREPLFPYHQYWNVILNFYLFFPSQAAEAEAKDAEVGFVVSV